MTLQLGICRHGMMMHESLESIKLFLKLLLFLDEDIQVVARNAPTQLASPFCSVSA